MFRLDELIGQQVCVEMDDHDIVAGTFDSSFGSYIVLRGESDSPILFHERFVRSIFLKPEVENDN